MKTFAEFYKKAVPNKWNNYSDHLIPACGDRAIIQIDGRLSLEDKKTIALEECKKRGFKGFKLLHGENILRNNAITDLQTI